MGLEGTEPSLGRESQSGLDFHCLSVCLVIKAVYMNECHQLACGLCQSKHYLSSHLHTISLFKGAGSKGIIRILVKVIIAINNYMISLHPTLAQNTEMHWHMAILG